MKCPKCGYLGFDAVDRCRNCGYEFSLARHVDAEPELPLRTTATADTFADLSIASPATAPSSPAAIDADFDRVIRSTPPARPDRPAANGEPAAASSRPPTPPIARDELPLFGSTSDDLPMITKPSPPRPPLAVRRSTPEVPRLRSESPRANTLDLALDVDASRSRASAPGATRTRAPEPQESGDDAGVGARVLAVIIDLVVLAIVDLAVVYLTMEICGLTMAEASILPKGPLIAFLIVQNGGYLIAFTAGGQTLGKMAARIRVVAADPGATVDLGRATTRTLMWVLLAIPGGLGFIPAVFSSDHRGLHDRFAGTRVVRASA